MAQPFNPYLDTQTGNYLGYSRGADAFSAIGTLAQGAGNIITAKANTIDKLTKMRIDEEARQKVEPVRDAAIHALETGQMTVPDEVRGGLNKAEQMKMAKEAGVLDESHYWNLLDAEARRLRAQHPGYKDYVDSRIASLAGADPANRLVQKLYDEQQALASTRRSDAQKERDKWETEYRKAGLAGDPNSPTGRDLSTTSTEEMKRDLSQLWAKQAKIKEEEANIDYKAKLRLNVVNDVIYSAGQQAQDTTTAMLKAGMKPFDDVISSWSKIQQGTAGNPAGKIDIQNVDELRSNFANLKRQAQTNIQEIFTRKRTGDLTYGYFLDDKQKDSIVKSAMQPIQMIEEALFNGDTGTIGAIQNRIKAIDGANVLNIYGMAKFAQRWAAFRDIFGPQAVPGILAETSKLGSDLAQAAKLFDGVTDLADPKRTLKDTFQSYSDAEGTKPQTYNSTVNLVVDHLRNGNPTTEGFRQSARYFFGRGNDNIFGQIDPDTGKVSLNFKDPYTLYQKMAGDPVIAQNMAKIKASDPKTYQSWGRFITTNFQTLMTSAAAEAQAVVESVPTSTVTWDPSLCSYK